MTRLIIVIALAAMTAFGQRGVRAGGVVTPFTGPPGFTSSTGFGRMMFPGTGGPAAGGVLNYGIATPPVGGAGFGRAIYPGTGGPTAYKALAPVSPGFTGFTGRVPRPVPPGRNQSPVRNRGLGYSGGLGYGGLGYGGLGYGYPIFYGPPLFDTYNSPAADGYADVYDPSQQRPPVMIINQGYQPEALNGNAYAPRPTQAALPPAPVLSPGTPRAGDEPPTIYQIALKDSSIQEALGYWVEGKTLNYITPEGVINRVSLDNVDRTRSITLNQTARVDFQLPKR